MGFFNWSAPLFGHFADRWNEADIGRIVSWLAPFLDRCTGQCHVLDVGGGTGALARRLRAATGANVTVLDPTPEMLRYVELKDGVRTVLGVAEDMPFADDEFDAIIVTDAFHHFRDQPRAAAEFHRVVRDGGGVVVLELDRRHAAIRVIAPMERLLGEPGSFFSPDEMCRFMASHGIEGECHAYSKVNYRYSGRVAKG